jgi:hypothetical protein
MLNVSLTHFLAADAVRSHESTASALVNGQYTRCFSYCHMHDRARGGWYAIVEDPQADGRVAFHLYETREGRDDAFLSGYLTWSFGDITTRMRRVATSYADAMPNPVEPLGSREDTMVSLGRPLVS